MLFMTHATTTAAVDTPQVRKLVLVPSTASGRGDEMVRRYRLARLADWRAARPSHRGTPASLGAAGTRGLSNAVGPGLARQLSPSWTLPVPGGSR